MCLLSLESKMPVVYRENRGIIFLILPIYWMEEPAVAKAGLDLEATAGTNPDWKNVTSRPNCTPWVPSPSRSATGASSHPIPLPVHRGLEPAMNTRADGFNCKQCGKCCQMLGIKYHVETTEEDVARWVVEKREDILEWVDPVYFPGAVEFDFPINPETKQEIEGCPFLKQLPNSDLYICAIHDTKPEGCLQFPTSNSLSERKLVTLFMSVFKVKME
jgi:Fe-S-cluster containining protein